MFSKKLAGIGAVAALVGSALVPSVAFALPSPDPTAPADKQITDETSVTVNKTVIDNDTIQNNSDVFSFTVTKTPCSEDGCVLTATDIPSFTKGLTVTGAGSVSDFMPAASAYTYGPGIYQWTVVESQTVNTSSSSTNGEELVLSKASYRIKAYISRDASGDLYYRAITIAKDANDAGTLIDPAEKVTSLDFENRYNTLTDFKVQKKVVGDGQGLDDPDAEYSMSITFTWPSNITSNPGITVDGTTCAPVSGTTTTCEFTLKKDQTATFANVPVGATYRLTETQGQFFHSDKSEYTGTVVDGAAAAAVPAGSTESGTGKDAVNFETVTNEYDDITPTGVILAVLPYVLMIGIPLLAIAGYIALRRKMNL